MRLATAITEPGQDIEAVDAALTYLVDTGEKPATYLFKPGDDPMRSTGAFEAYDVSIRNGRPVADRFDLDREGFVFGRHETKVDDFFDEAELRAVYDAEIERLVMDASGARRVVVFDQTIRVEDEGKRQEKSVREPVPIVHNDYTESSARQRVRDFLPDEADDLISRRFAIIQVWRPIGAPVKTKPLAICDAQSVRPENLVASDLVYKDRLGETMRVSFSPEHRWYYFPDMARDEAMVFKVYDSADDGRARFTAHTAFDDPTAPRDAPPRESIESRTFAFF